MKSFLKYLWLCIAFLLPLTTQAEPTGTVIFEHPENSNELWITNLEDTRNARLLYKGTHPIYALAAQKDGPLIIMSVIDRLFATNAYLFNRNRPHKEARNLTQKRFGGILDVDISEAGDIVFTNNLRDGALPPKEGVFLIPNHEIEKPVPKATLLREVEADRVVWSPDGKQIAYDVRGKRGVYTFNIETREVLEISKFGEYPAFSPDGKKLAFVDIPFGIPQDIYVVSLANLDDFQTLDIEDRSDFWQLKWSPDGQYIIYTTIKNNLAAPVNGGRHVKLFEQFPRPVPYFDWASPKEYAVEPIDRLTTLWGKLKQ